MTKSFRRRFQFPPKPHPPTFSAAWRCRIALIGISAILFAVIAEHVLRTSSGSHGLSPLAAPLLYFSIMLVGFTQWIRSGVRAVAYRRTVSEDSGESFGSGDTATSPFFVRGRLEPGVQSPDGSATGVPTGARGIHQMIMFWARIAGAEIALGVAVSIGLAAWCFVLLLQNFAQPLAPRLWIASLGVLVVTFTGAAAWPSSRTSMICDDPEPPISRNEWVLIGCVLLVAAVVRLWNLEMIPTGPYTDEADRAVDARHVIRGEPVNRAPFLLFGTGWWGVPSLYFWMLGQSMRVFGDTLAGARAIHALAGIGTVWYTYRIGRVAWSPRAGLMAGALLAVSDFAIQFSRTAGESTLSLFASTACLYYLYGGLKNRRPLNWVFSGIWAGLALYGYAAAKLLPLMLGLVAVYVLIRGGRLGARLYAPGFTLMAVAGLLTWAPNALYAAMHQDAFLMRYQAISIFSSQNAAYIHSQFHTDNLIVVAVNQAATTFRAFDIGTEAGPFYPTGIPVLPLVWAALWMLGIAYVLLRASDVRFAVLGIWMVGGLAGSALTTDAPTLQRTAVMVPTLALVPAIFLDRVARDFTSISLPRRRLTVPYFFVNIAACILVLVLGIQTLYFYFGVYTPRHVYADASYAGRYVQTLNRQRVVVYTVAEPPTFWWQSSFIFLTDGYIVHILRHAADALPLRVPPGTTVHFLVFPSSKGNIRFLRTSYPRGRVRTIRRDDGTIYFVDYYSTLGRSTSSSLRTRATRPPAYSPGGVHPSGQ